MRSVVSAVLALVLLAGCTSTSSEGSPDRPASTAGPATPTTRVVAPGGDDRATGTEAEPWGTIAAALPRLHPGDTLLIRDGTYRERIRGLPLRPGRADRRITVRAWPGERPEIEGLLWLDRPSHWTVAGLAITWDRERAGRKDHMVKVTDGIGWTFEDNDLSGARSYAALLIASTRDDEPDRWEVAGNCIRDTRKANGTNQDHLLYVNSGTGPGAGRIAGNLLFGAPNGSGIKLGGSADDEGGASNVVVETNTIWDAAQSILVAWRASDNEIRRNLMGRTGRNYAAVRGYRLSGEGNEALGNVVADTEGVLLNDDGYERVVDQGGNVVVDDPGFDSTDSCAGFRPTDRSAVGVGHLAVSEG